MGVAGRGCDEDDEAAGGVGGSAWARMASQASSRACWGSVVVARVDEHVSPVARPELPAARDGGLEVAGHCRGGEEAGAENGGWVGGRVHSPGPYWRRETGRLHVDPNSCGQRRTDERIARLASRRAGRSAAAAPAARVDRPRDRAPGQDRAAARRSTAASTPSATTPSPSAGACSPRCCVAGPARRAEPPDRRRRSTSSSPRCRRSSRSRPPRRPPLTQPRGLDLPPRRATLDATTQHGLPVTTVPRTLQDLAATRPAARGPQGACSEALVHRLVVPDELADREGPGSKVLKRPRPHQPRPPAPASNAASSRR